MMKGSVMQGSVTQGLASAIQAEFYVALRSRMTLVLCVLPSLVAMAQLLLTRSLSSSAQAREALTGSGNFGGSAGIEGADAWGALVDALGSGLALISLMLVAYAAWSFASDRDLGVVRHLVIRRISRPALVLGKLVLVHALALASIVLLLLSTRLLASLLWEFGPVVEDGYELISLTDIQSELRLGLLLALIPIPAGIALGLMLSVACNSTTQALSAALGITLGLDLFKSALGSAADYLYLSYQVSLLDDSYLNDVARLVRGYSDVMLQPETMQLNQWVPWPQMLLFVIVALIWVQRKKL